MSSYHNLGYTEVVFHHYNLKCNAILLLRKIGVCTDILLCIEIGKVVIPSLFFELVHIVLRTTPLARYNEDEDTSGKEDEEIIIKMTQTQREAAPVIMIT